MIHATMGGAKADPSLAQQSKQAEANVLSLAGTQTDTTRALAGNPGASVKPSAIRIPKNMAKFWQTPVSMVTRPQPAAENPKICLGPKRLSRAPAGIMVMV
jgi:hypothetical protein